MHFMNTLIITKINNTRIHKGELTSALGRKRMRQKIFKLNHHQRKGTLLFQRAILFCLSVKELFICFTSQLNISFLHRHNTFHYMDVLRKSTLFFDRPSWARPTLSVPWSSQAHGPGSMTRQLYSRVLGTWSTGCKSCVLPQPHPQLG